MKHTRLLALVLALVLIVSLTACGGGNKKAIVGSWELTDGDGATYGMGVVFNKDGTMTYGLDLGGTGGDEWAEAMEGLKGLLEVKYKIKSDTVMEVEASALFGLAKEKADVEYSLNGDSLYFDGSTYTRVI